MIIGGHGTWSAAAAEILRRYGYTTEECRTLSIASAKLKTLSPVLLVVDTQLSDGDPLDFIRDLRKRSSVPIIVCDRDARLVEGAGAFEAGADDYVSRSCSCEELAWRARGILARLRGDRVVNSTSIDQ